jgi:OFA family oxalate/formate antiporter-like MFS transporter
MPMRLRYLILGIIIQLCIGNVYAWDVFRIPLQYAYGWTVFQAASPLVLSAVTFALGMLAGGRSQDKAGPRPVAVTGSILLGVGLMLSSFLGSTLAGLYLGFSLIGGLGAGFAFVTAIAVPLKWWPDRRSLMSGLVLMGLGAGTIIGGIVGPLLVQAVGVLPTFLIFGIIFGALVAGCGSLLKDPPPGWKPAGWSPPAPPPDGRVVRLDYPPGEMLKTTTFWLLWIMCFISVGVGLSIFSQGSPMGQEVAKLTPIIAEGALAFGALVNGLGRPVLGLISDAVGRRNAMALVFALHLVALVLALPNATTVAIYSVGLCLVGFAFGGTLALMPVFTADYFGSKNLGINYGWLYTAYWVASLVSPIFTGQVRAAAGSWTKVFWVLAGVCVVGLLCAVITRPPAPKEVEATR